MPKSLTKKIILLFSYDKTDELLKSIYLDRRWKQNHAKKFRKKLGTKGFKKIKDQTNPP